MAAKHVQGGTRCCLTALRRGWLQWVYSRLRQMGPTYPADANDATLLYETLAITLHVDLLGAFGPPFGRPKHNLVTNRADEGDAVARLRSIGDGLSDTWQQIRVDQLDARLPVWSGDVVWMRRVTVADTFLILGVDGDPEGRVCVTCLTLLRAFLRSPGHNVDGITASVLSLPSGPPLPTPHRGRDTISNLVTLAAAWFQKMFAVHRTYIPKEFDYAVESVANTLRQHAFSMAVVFNHAALAGMEGFGYFLTAAQEDQILKRLAGRFDAYHIAYARRLLQGFAFGVEKQKGLVAFVTEYARPLWATRIYSERLYAADEEAARWLGAVEDLVVHKVHDDPNTGNFIMETPVYLTLEDEAQRRAAVAIAAFFFVLEWRPPAPVMAILQLSARAALTPFIAAVPAGLGVVARTWIRRNRWLPLLLRERRLSDPFLMDIFPRVHDRPTHNVEFILSASLADLHEITNTIRDRPAYRELRAYNDVEALCRLAETATDVNDARWARWCLKMRVREKTRSLERHVYVIDLFHYLVGWYPYPSSDLQYMDLVSIVGPIQKDCLDAFTQCDISLTVEHVQPDGAIHWVVLAERRHRQWPAIMSDSQADGEQAKTGYDDFNLWLARVGNSKISDPLTAGWNPNDVSLPSYWLYRARVLLPSYPTDDASGPLGMFLRMLAERIGEDQPSRINLTFRRSDSRLRLELLWSDETKSRRVPPGQLLPVDTRTHGGDMGTIETILDRAVLSGWFISLPVVYEGGGNSALAAQSVSGKVTHVDVARASKKRARRVLGTAK